MLKQSKILYLTVLTFRKTNSHIKPVPSSSAPMTIKSNSNQFTSVVICIARNGMNSRKATILKTIIYLWFFTLIIFIMDSNLSIICFLLIETIKLNRLNYFLFFSSIHLDIYLVLAVVWWSKIAPIKLAFRCCFKFPFIERIHFKKSFS